MKAFDIISLQGSKVNEDLIMHSNRIYCILDGASGLSEKKLLPGGSDAKWFVEHCALAIKTVSKNNELSLKEIIHKAINIVISEFTLASKRRDAKPYEMPSAGIVLMRIRNRLLEAVLLGDCRLLINKQDGSHLNYVTIGLEELDSISIEEFQRHLKKYNYFESRRRTMPTLRKHRSLMNTKEGYWILSLSNEPEQHMLEITQQLSPNDRILLVTDGFYRLVDTFHLFDSKILVEQSAEKGLSELGARLRDLERADPECKLTPRLKPSDDASALLLVV